MERFGQTEHARFANDVAWACALAPAAVADLDRPIRLAEKAVAAEPRNSSYRNTLGALLYRAGRFPAAGECLREALRLDKGQGTPEDWLFLAMTEHRLGRDAQARGWLDKALKWIEAANNDQLKWADGSIPSLAQRTQLQLLRREAEALLAVSR